MLNTTVRTTLVGCGAVAQKLYCKPLRALDRRGILSIKALVDIDRENAAMLARYFPGATVSNDLAQALRATESELTLVLSPVQYHADHAVVALTNNNHVLCEKPLAATGADCARVLAAARSADRMVAVGMIRRFFPAFATLKTLIDSHQLGEIRSFCYREGKVFDWAVKTPAGFIKTNGSGAGLLFDIGPHVLDYLMWLFGVPNVLSYADDAVGGVEANVVMHLEAPGSSGSVHVSWDSPMRNELRVFGSQRDAVLRVDQFDKLAINKDGRFHEVPLTTSYPADTLQPSRRRITPRLYTESIYCQLIQVIRAIRLGEVPAVSGAAGQECVRILESARMRARPMDLPWLPDHQQETHRKLHWTNSKWDRSQLSVPADSLAPALSNR